MNNEDPSGLPNNSPLTNSPGQEPLEPGLNTPPVVPAENKRFSKKKIVLLTLLALVLLGGSAAVWFMTRKDSNKPTSQSSVASPAATKTSPYFYLAPDTKTIGVYNADTKAKSSIAITVGENEESAGGSLGSNKSVQISANGQAIAYSTARCGSQGEGCDQTNSYLYLKTGSNTEQIVKLNAPQQLDDWIMSPDGKTIFYLVNKDNSKPAGFDLHKITTADKKDTLIKQNIFGAATVNEKTPMFALGNDSFRVYDNGSDVTEYRYENGGLTSRDLGINKFCGDCRVEYGQPLSTDGKTLILKSGSTSSVWIYYTLDLTTGTHKQIVKTAKTTEQLLNGSWSPDGKSIAYDIVANGIAGQNEVGFKNRFEVYDIATGKTTVGFTDPSPGVNDQNYSKNFVELLGWSPDAAYIAFLNNDSVKLYKLDNASTTDTGVGTQNPISSNVGFGWYSK